MLRPTGCREPGLRRGGLLLRWFIPGVRGWACFRGLILSCFSVYFPSRVWGRLYRRQILPRVLFFILLVCLFSASCLDWGRGDPHVCWGLCFMAGHPGKCSCLSGTALWVSPWGGTLLSSCRWTPWPCLRLGGRRSPCLPVLRRVPWCNNILRFRRFFRVFFSATNVRSGRGGRRTQDRREGRSWLCRFF